MVSNYQKAINFLLVLSVFFAFSLQYTRAFAQDTPPIPTKVTVKYIIFSGRPNPEWYYDNVDDIEKLKEFITGLPEAVPVDETFFGGGFLLRLEGEQTLFPKRALIHNGIIKATTADNTIQFFQDTLGFEAFLRTEAEERGLIKR